MLTFLFQSPGGEGGGARCSISIVCIFRSSFESLNPLFLSESTQFANHPCLCLDLQASNALAQAMSCRFASHRIASHHILRIVTAGSSVDAESNFDFAPLRASGRILAEVQPLELCFATSSIVSTNPAGGRCQRRPLRHEPANDAAKKWRGPGFGGDHRSLHVAFGPLQILIAGMFEGCPAAAHSVQFKLSCRCYSDAAFTHALPLMRITRLDRVHCCPWSADDEMSSTFISYVALSC